MNIIEQFFIEHRYSDATETTYRWYLNDFLGSHPDPSGITAVGFRDWLEGHETWGGNSKHTAYCAVRVFMRWRYGDDHPALKYRRKREETGPQRTLTAEQVEQIYYHFDSSGIGQRGQIGIRDIALCSVALDTGLRASELCRLDVKHIHIDHADVSHIIAHVKGGSWEARVISPHTAHDLEAWLSIRDTIAGDEVTACFVSLGCNRGQPLTRHGLRAIVRNWGQRSGVGHISPHDLKRTGATLATTAGAPDRTVIDQFGWRDRSMLDRYTQALRKREFLRYSPVTFVRGK